MFITFLEWSKAMMAPLGSEVSPFGSEEVQRIGFPYQKARNFIPECNTGLLDSVI